ncbi:secreted protein, putative, partial [Ixodes scapularis]
SPFYWLRDNPVDRTANANLTLNATTMTSETTTVATTTIATTLATTTVATTEASTTEPSTTSATTTMGTSNTTFNTTAATTTVMDLLATAPPANYSSNYSTVNLDELALAIGHLQDPVLKLVTEADGTANFVVFDGRQGASETVSTSTIAQDLTTVTSEAAPTSTTALPTSLESDAPPSEASTTITVEPRSVPVTTLPLQTPPAGRSPHPSATAATVAATSGADLVPQSATVGTVMTATTTRPVPASTVLSTTIVTMAMSLPTGTTPVSTPSSTTTEATNTTYADNTKFPDVTADFKTTTGPPFNTRSATHGEGRVTTQFKVTRPTSFVVASSTVPLATHH